jgi:hypothetical protein
VQTDAKFASLSGDGKLKLLRVRRLPWSLAGERTRLLFSNMLPALLVLQGADRRRDIILFHDTLAPAVSLVRQRERMNDKRG